MKENDTGPILTLPNPCQNSDNQLWLATSISLLRNIEKFHFPAKLNAERQKQISALISKELLVCPCLKEPVLVKAEETSPLEKGYLAEHFLSAKTYQQAHSGESFIIDSTGEFMATLNIDNHIEFMLLETKGELESAWSRLTKIELAVGKNLSYAFSPKYGFLTADPFSAGTGMHVSLFLQLPAIVQNESLEDILDNYANENILITGMQGSPTEIVGDILVVHNNYTLGVSEENIIADMRNFVTKILVEENSLRANLRNTPSSEMKDRVSRALGVLVHSYQINAAEALDAISMLKLGADLNWLEGVTCRQLNQLFFTCRRAHLLHEVHEEIPQEEIAHKRAEYIHKVLQETKLLI